MFRISQNGVAKLFKISFILHSSVFQNISQNLISSLKEIRNYYIFIHCNLTV